MRAHRTAGLLCLLVAACILAPSAIAQVRAPDRRQNAATQPAARALQLDASMAMIAFHRLSGSSPDFDRQAELSQAYRSATAFDRDQVRTRERSRLEAQFRTFDLSQPYLVRVSTTLTQYDATRGGYAIPFNESSYVTFWDSTSGRQIGVQIRNVEALNFIALPNVASARAFAERNKLDMQSNVAASIVVEATVRLVEAVPSQQSGKPFLIRADALSARVLRNGDTRAAPIHVFAFAAPVAASTTLVEKMLKAADVQALRIGMAVSEAEALAAASYPAGSQQQAGGGVAYFEGLAADAPRLCGVERGAGSPVRRPDGTPVFFDVPDHSSACLEFQTEGGRLTRIASGQRLDSSTREEIRAALEEKYGPPSLVQEGGSFLTWQGPDPAAPGGPALQINARIQEVGTGALRSVLLGIEARQAGAPVPTTATRAPGGPRL